MRLENKVALVTGGTRGIGRGIVQMLANEGAAVAFTGRSGDLPVRSVPTLDRVLRLLFSSRRKQLANLLPRLTNAPAELALRAGWPIDWGRHRPEDLEPESFFRLANALEAHAG